MFNISKRQTNIAGRGWHSNNKPMRIGAYVVLAGALAGTSLYVRHALSTHKALTPAYVGFDPDTIDLGTQLWKQKVQFSLNFVNNSPAPVRLRALKTSCGCTFIDRDRYQNRVIKPSETLTVDVSLDTQSTAGLKSRRVTFVAADGAAYTVNVSVDVKAPYHLEPRIVNFGLLPESTEPVQRSVAFISDSVALILDPQIDQPWLAATYIKRDDSHTDILVTVTPEKLLYGLNIGSVIIRTTDALTPRNSIKVIARGGLPLRPIPPHVVLRAGEVKLVTFLLASDGSHARIQAASSDNPSLQTDVSADGSVSVRSLSRTEVRFATVRVRDSSGLTGKVLVSMLQGE